MARYSACREDHKAGGVPLVFSAAAAYITDIYYA